MYLVNDSMNQSMRRKIFCVGSHAADFSLEIFNQMIFDFQKKLADEKTGGSSPGEKKLGQLATSGNKLESVEIPKSIAYRFDKYARKNGVQYALQSTKQKNEKGDKLYLLYFKSKDVDSLQKAMKQYIKAHGKVEEKKPSVRQKVQQLDREIKQQSHTRVAEKRRNLSR